MMSSIFWHIFYNHPSKRYLCYSKRPESNPKLKTCLQKILQPLSR